MIEDKNNRTNNNKLNLFADTENNLLKTVKNDVNQVNEAEVVYDSLVAASFQVSDETSKSKDIQIYKLKLEELGRKDLLDKYQQLMAQRELERKKELDKIILDKINQIIDTSKVDQNLIPYIIDIEKRIQALETKICQ